MLSPHPHRTSPSYQRLLFTLHSTNIQDAKYLPLPNLRSSPNLQSPCPSYLHPARTIPDPNLELAEHFLKTTLIEGPLPSAQLLAEARPRHLHRHLPQPRPPKPPSHLSFRTCKRHHPPPQLRPTRIRNLNRIFNFSLYFILSRVPTPPAESEPNIPPTCSKMRSKMRNNMATPHAHHASSRLLASLLH